MHGEMNFLLSEKNVSRMIIQAPTINGSLFATIGQGFSQSAYKDKISSAFSSIKP